MALPIKPTPILEGKDAERFLNNMNKPKKVNKKKVEKSLDMFKEVMNKNISRYRIDGIYLVGGNKRLAPKKNKGMYSPNE